MRLSASFDLAVSTCIWLSLLAPLDVSTAKLWAASAFFLAGQANWSILRLADEQALSNFVGSGSSDTVPPELDLTNMDVKTLPWSGVSAPTMPVLLLVQNVLHMALFHQAGESPDDSINKAIPQMNGNMIYIRSHQRSAKAASSPDKVHINSLRAALLMLKTIQLLLLVKIQLNKQSQTRLAVVALCQGILMQSSEASDRLNDASSMQLTAAEHKEAERLSVLLVKMALPVMKQLLKEKWLSATCLHEWNCQLLTSLLPRNRPSTLQAVVAEITSSGVVPYLPQLWTVLLQSLLPLVTCSWLPSEMSLPQAVLHLHSVHTYATLPILLRQPTHESFTASFSQGFQESHTDHSLMLFVHSWCSPCLAGTLV